MPGKVFCTIVIMLVGTSDNGISISLSWSEHALIVNIDTNTVVDSFKKELTLVSCCHVDLNIKASATINRNYLAGDVIGISG